MANVRSSHALVSGSQKRIFATVYRREPRSCLQQADVLLSKRLIRLALALDRRRHSKTI